MNIQNLQYLMIFSIASLLLVCILSYLSTIFTSKYQSTLKKTLELERIYKLAVESSTNHIIITNVDGIIIFANEAAQKITGYSFLEMKDHTPKLWGQLMPSDFYKKLWTTIKIDKKSFKGEILNHRKNGHKYTAIATISPIIDKENQLLGFIGMEEDITELKNTEKNLMNRTAELEVLNKLMVGRELKMIDLKAQLKKLKEDKNEH